MTGEMPNWRARPVAWAKHAAAAVPLPAGTASWRQSAATWLERRTPRERTILLAGVIVVLVGIVYLALWQPLRAAQARAIARIAVLDRVVAQAQAIDPASVTLAPASAAPAATIVANSAAEFALPIKRLETEGRQIRVALDDVKFDTLLLWLDRLSAAHRLNASGVELERRPEPGVVSARLVLEPR